jgi:Reverse transcriptase (RNA-dependent DNA polymerase)
LRYKEVPLSAFIELGLNPLGLPAERRQIDPETIKSVIRILECRIVTANLGEEHITVRTTKSCLQRGVLSPLLWSFIIDKLLTDLKQPGFEVIRFVDDLVIIVRKKAESVLNERLQIALNYATVWWKDALEDYSHSIH